MSDETIAQWQSNAVLQGISASAGFPVVPGTSASHKADGKMPFSKAPQLLRNDFVQNSNDSFWLTNPNNPIENVSPLWGLIGNQQSLRSRLGQKMLAEGGSVNGLFSREDIANKLLSNRAFLAEAVLDDLVDLCTAQGSNPVNTAAGAMSIKPGCDVLAQWDGTMNKDSVGAMLFREFASEWSRNPQWQVPYDASQPLTNPQRFEEINSGLDAIRQCYGAYSVGRLVD